MARTKSKKSSVFMGGKSQISNTHMVIIIIAVAILAAFLSAYGYGKWRASEIRAQASGYATIFPLNGVVDQNQITIKACKTNGFVNVTFFRSPELQNPVSSVSVFNKSSQNLNTTNNSVWWDQKVNVIRVNTGSNRYISANITDEPGSTKNAKSSKISVASLPDC